MTLNGEEVTMPMHKSYNDGSQIQLEDIGTFSAFKFMFLVFYQLQFSIMS